MKFILTVITIFFLATLSSAAEISENDVKAFLDNWLSTQNNGTYSNYAALYSAKFQGIKRSGDRTSRFNHDTWLKNRKQMFKNKMHVSAADVRLQTSEASVIVQFEQNWESNGYKDKGGKQLCLVLENNRLKIAREEMIASMVLTEPKVNFSSAYTYLQKDCRDKFDDVGEGQDMPVICKGYGEYIIDVEFSACCEHMHVQGGKDFLFQFPAQRFVTVMKRIVEWRLANGKPFAVIFPIDKYKRHISDTPNKISGEILIIKGLEGNENINYQIDMKKHPNPYKEARKLVDQGYMQLRTK